MIESDDDRRAFVNPKDFGAEYQSSKGPIRGVFFNGHSSSFGDTDIEGTSPSLIVRTVDADRFVKDDVIETTPPYRIDHKEVDDSGDMTTLVLRL